MGTPRITYAEAAIYIINGVILFEGVKKIA